jgi:ABC-type bacteriocin/lantibiotic exporter with double-glycine peptidase domain
MTSVFGLHRTEKIKLFVLSVFQFLSSVLEVLALGLIGVFSFAITARLTSQDLDFTSQNILSPFRRFLADDTESLLVIGVIAVSLLLFKTALGIFLNRILNNNLANITVRISLEKLNEVEKVNYSWINRQKSAEFSYYLGQGINSDLKGMLLGGYTIVSELIFIFSVFTFLALTNFPLTLSIIILMIVFFALIYLSVSKKFKLLNQREVSLLIRNQNFSIGLFRSFKELLISNNLSLYKSQMRQSRIEENTTRARMQWLEQLPKYGLELVVLIFGIVILVVSALPSDAILGTTSIIVFSVALTRLTPSFLRLQGAFVLYEANKQRVKSSLDFFSGLRSNVTEAPSVDGSENDPGLPVVDFLGVDFEYESGKKIVENFSHRFEPGMVNCIVGASGAGKSTILELILGLISPSSGKVLVGNANPVTWRILNPDSAYYLPQEVALLESSLYENITMKSGGISESDLDSIQGILDKVGLADLVSYHPNGLMAILGTEVHLSGGERQRLGIARALFKKTKLLILDEPTSSLDEKTELSIFQIFREISKDCTVILVTHSQLAADFFPHSLIRINSRGI